MSDDGPVTEEELDAEIGEPQTWAQVCGRLNRQVGAWAAAANRLEKIAIIAREFVEAQAELAHGDFAAREFDKLSAALAKLYPPGAKIP